MFQNENMALHLQRNCNDGVRWPLEELFPRSWMPSCSHYLVYVHKIPFTYADIVTDVACEKKKSIFGRAWLRVCSLAATKSALKVIMFMGSPKTHPSLFDSLALVPLLHARVI